jgi:tetratricopeptide (TPR) repeat protein
MSNLLSSSNPASIPATGAHSRRRVTANALSVLALCAALASSAVWADDYADVNRLLKAGQLSEALGKADLYLASKPRDPQMRFIKGVILSESGKPADAISTFTKLTEDYPELPEPYNNLAVLYANQSQFDKARAALEMAIRTNPSYATAHENLGDVYAKLASQAYSRALQLDSTNTGVQPKLALIRELFAPGAKGQKPGVTVAAAAPAPAPALPPLPSFATRPSAAPAPAAASAPATAAAPAAAAPAPAAPSGDTKDIEAAVQAWAAAWAAKDVSGYLAAYGKDFDTPGKQARKAWEDERRKRIVGKSRISVKLSQIKVSVNGGKARANFRQDYNADSLSVSSHKVLDLVKAGDRWVIVRESTGS